MKSHKGNRSKAYALKTHNHYSNLTMTNVRTKKKNQPIVMHSPLIGAMLKGYTFFDEQYKNILNKR